MLNLKLAIFDREILYVQKLSQYLLSNREYSFSIQVFSDLKLLQDFLNNHSIDILLIDSKAFIQGKNELKAELVILLTDGCVEADFRSMFCIHKLQAAKEIVKEIIQAYSCVCNKEIVGVSGKGAKLICVYSPAGGCGKTTISIALGHALARKGLRVLYIGLEEFSSCRQMLQGSFEEGLSDLLYYISKDCKNMMMKLEGIRERDEVSGLFFIPPPIFGGELFEFDPISFVGFIQDIVRAKTYDVIILDLSSHFSRLNQVLMEECDKRIYVVPNTYGGRLKWLEYLKEGGPKQDNGQENLKEKGNIIWVLNRLYFSGEDKKMEEGQIGQDLEIPFEKGLHGIREEGNAFRHAMEDLGEVVLKDA